VKDCRVTIHGEPDIAFETVTPVLERQLEGSKRVLWRVPQRSAMTEEEH
jgi:hypothetical protein